MLKSTSLNLADGMIGVRRIVAAALAVSLVLVLSASPGQGQEPQPGQEDLDQATLVKLSAKQLSDLEKVVNLCQSAIDKGLSDENATYAEQLMAATLYEHASKLSQLIFNPPKADPRWARIRQICLDRLDRSLQLRPDFGPAYLLRGRLLALPQGDRQLAYDSAEKAIELLEDNPDLQSDAYRLRGGLRDNQDEALNDLNQAVELNPRNRDAWRTRGLFHLSRRDYEKALADLEKLLELNPDDTVAHQAIAQALTQTNQLEDALEHLDQVLKTNPKSSIAHNLRARIEELRGNTESAIESLNRAIDAQPQDLAALLYRARLRTMQEQFDLARGDIERALQLRPQMPQAILLRSLISAAQSRFGEAIGDVQRLLRKSPGNVDLMMQLASYFEYDHRPRRAIETYDEILKVDPQNLQVLRRRGDARLSIGEQALAIEDYQAALQVGPEDTGVLNNLAWVLVTSPDDELRDGQQAVELAKQACELTNYEQPHIISTLAACHAELGNFEEAIKWSEKAVGMDSPQKEQLKAELEAYRKGEPWREKQVIEENASDLATDLFSDELPLPSLDDASQELDDVLDVTPAKTESPASDKNQPAEDPQDVATPDATSDNQP